MWHLHVNVGPLRLATFRLPYRPSFAEQGSETIVRKDDYAELGILDDGGTSIFTVVEAVETS